MPPRLARVCFGGCLLLLASSTAAEAQLSFPVKHNWKWEVAGKPFGIVEHEAEWGGEFMTDV